jgi:hypothetical protein
MHFHFDRYGLLPARRETATPDGQRHVGHYAFAKKGDSSALGCDRKLFGNHHISSAYCSCNEPPQMPWDAFNAQQLHP